MSKDWTGDSNSIFKQLGASNHCEEEREANDYYATDPRAIDDLLSIEKFSNDIWECASGGGHGKERKNIEYFINYILGTHFNHDDYQYIYEKLGNRVNHKLTVQFVESGYDMNLLGKVVLL